MAIAIKAENIHKSYGDVKVLKGISFEVKEGTIQALLGPNGAGKTTMVRILSTLLKNDKGTATIGGYDIGKEADNVRSVIGLTGQAATVDELLTGRENLIMIGRLYRLTKKSATERADELLKDFDLVEAADRTAKTYSGGMRRRLDLAVSLVAAPPIIFLDEPTTGLDPRSRLSMWKIIQKLVDQGTTILLTTQYLEEADQLADNIIVIDNGVVIAQGTAEQLKSKVGSDRLELTFADKKTLELAEKTLSKRSLDVDTKQLLISTQLSNPTKDTHQILGTLSDKKVSIATMAIHKPTLDDVFLSVTRKGKGE